MDPVRVLERTGGAARLETLTRAGVTRGGLRRAVDDGRVIRPRYGCYALPGATGDAVLRAAYRAEMSCLSLCRALGLPIIEDDRRTHLWIPRNRARRADDRRPIRGVVLHRHDHPAGALSDRASTGLDLMGLCCGRMQQIVAVDAALHAGLIEVSALDGWVHTPPDRRDWLRRRCDGRAESPLETITRVTLAEEGLDVVSQVQIHGIGRVDLLVEGRLVVETDGQEFHLNSRAWVEDVRRNNAGIVQGRPVLRFTYADVMGDRTALVRTVLAALGR